MLSNVRIGVPYFTVPKLASVVFNEPYEKLNLITPPDVDRELAEKYTGRIPIWRRFLQIERSCKNNFGRQEAFC